MEIILFIFAVSILFPGSSHGGSFELMMIPAFIACAALVIAFLAAIGSAAFTVAELTGNMWLGLAAGLGLFFGSLFVNKWVAERAPPG